MSDAIEQLEEMLSNMQRLADTNSKLRAEQTSFANSELLLHIINGLINSGALPETAFGDFAIALRGKALSIVLPEQQQMTDALENLADRLQLCEEDRATRR
ncbi:hypothetical protein [Leisingera sp. ANG-S3]|uniref:hypothetical protein n=1 Tax=Leisingera sp. ANG-S3 TaxID=1577899 RepID=UPI001269DF69|nr:hypothetical protein [Leisingera sp. ANG-S3]